MQQNALAFSVASALLVAGCMTSGQAVDASQAVQTSTARAVVGTSLIGARGATPRDQDKIDDTAAGLCGAQVWTQSECVRHQEQAAP
jgi:hypothetical protein